LELTVKVDKIDKMGIHIIEWKVDRWKLINWEWEEWTDVSCVAYSSCC